MLKDKNGHFAIYIKLLKSLLNKVGDQTKKRRSQHFYFSNSDKRRKPRITGVKMTAWKLFNFVLGGCRQYSLMASSPPEHLNNEGGRGIS